MQKELLEMVISIIFQGLPFELPNINVGTKIGQESGMNLYAQLLDVHTNHRMSLNIRQKFILLAHYRFIISKILGNYQVGTRSLTHHTPTMQTIFVLQNISINFFKPIEPIYPFELSYPPITLNKCCELLAIIDRLLKRNPQLGNIESIRMLRIESISMLRLVQSCAFANIGIKIDRDAAFGLDSSYLGSITYWRELTPQMFWAWANQDGLLKRMILRFISNINHCQASKVDMIYDGIIRRASPQP